MLQQLQYECLFSYHIESGITKLSIPNFCFWSDPPSPQYIASVSVVDWWLCYWNMTWVIWCHGGVTREWWWDIAPSGFVLSTFSQGTSPTIFNIITHSVWFPCDTMLTMQKKKVLAMLIIWEIKWSHATWAHEIQRSRFTVAVEFRNALMVLSNFLWQQF